MILSQLKSDLENLSAAEAAVQGGDLLSWSSGVQDFLYPGYGRCGVKLIPHHSHLVDFFSLQQLEKRNAASGEGR